MLVLEWREAARADLTDILDYIVSDNPDAALQLLEEIESKAMRLTDHPKLYRRGRVEGTREMVVRSNYVVVYSEDIHAVTVLRVLHTARLWPPPKRY